MLLIVHYVIMNIDLLSGDVCLRQNQLTDSQ